MKRKDAYFFLGSFLSGIFVFGFLGLMWSTYLHEDNYSEFCIAADSSHYHFAMDRNDFCLIDWTEFFIPTVATAIFLILLCIFIYCLRVLRLKLLAE